MHLTLTSYVLYTYLIVTTAFVIDKIIIFSPWMWSTWMYCVSTNMVWILLQNSCPNSHNLWQKYQLMRKFPAQNNKLGQVLFMSRQIICPLRWAGGSTNLSAPNSNEMYCGFKYVPVFDKQLVPNCSLDMRTVCTWMSMCEKETLTSWKCVTPTEHFSFISFWCLFWTKHSITSPVSIWLSATSCPCTHTHYLWKQFSDAHDFML